MTASSCGTQMGDFNDSAIVRRLLTEVIRNCSKSREQIAEDMSFALGLEVTVRQINGWTAESRDDYRFPAEYDRAFCYTTGDDRLLKCRAELAGYRVITSDEAQILELGRLYLVSQKAAEKVALLEKRLSGVRL